MLAVHDRRGSPLAVLGFSTAAWRLASRDTFIGRAYRKRERNLPLVMDNPRFLILPWIQIPDLGSHLLSIVCRRLTAEWSRRYKVTPVPMETFVEIPTYTHGHGLPSLGMDTCRNHRRTRTLRQVQKIRQTRKGHPDETASQELEANPQQLKTLIQHALTERFLTTKQVNRKVL